MFSIDRVLNYYRVNVIFIKNKTKETLIVRILINVSKKNKKQTECINLLR